MYTFNHLDYLGDAILRIIAIEIGISKVNTWKWHTNKEQAKLYDAIFLLALNGQKKDGRRMVKSLHDGTKRTIKSKSISNAHQKASYIEAWIGEEYIRNGLDAAKELFFRMLEVTNNDIYC